VDTKKKELVGNFKNPGTCWRKDARDVLDHDFPSDAAGRAIPFGIYDQGWNTGFVVVGTSHETAEVTVHALGVEIARTESACEPLLLPELLYWRDFAPINWCWGPVSAQVHHGSWRERLRGGNQKPNDLAGCKWR